MAKPESRKDATNPNRDFASAQAKGGKPRGEQGDQGEVEAPAPGETDSSKIRPDDAEEEEGTSGKTGESDAGVTERAPHFRAGPEEKKEEEI